MPASRVQVLTAYGPEPIVLAGSRPKSSPVAVTFASLKMLQAGAASWYRKPANGCASVIVKWVSSATAMPLSSAAEPSSTASAPAIIVAKLLCTLSGSASMRVKVNFTSLAVSGVPSEKVTPLRSVKS